MYNIFILKNSAFGEVRILEFLATIKNTIIEKIDAAKLLIIYTDFDPKDKAIIYRMLDEVRVFIGDCDTDKKSFLKKQRE